MPTSSSASNSYFGRVGNEIIDENYVTYAGEHLYRPQVDIATEVTADFPGQQFYAAQQTDPTVADYAVGWWAAASWLNYTRTIPTNNYDIYARLAGGNGPYSVRLDQVTSGSGTSQQTTQILGYFSVQGRGWQRWDWVPLLTASGQTAVVSLGGINTLRATMSGNANANFYLLAPAPAPVNLRAAVNGANATLL